MNDNFDDYHKSSDEAVPATIRKPEIVPIVDCTQEDETQSAETTNHEIAKNLLLSELKDIQQDFTFGKIDAFLMKYQVDFISKYWSKIEILVKN